MKDENCLEIIVKRPLHSRTNTVLDATSIAVALACAGTFPCAGIGNTEIDKLDADKLCRTPTEDTFIAKNWNEYRPRPLLDEEDTVLSWESCASSKLDDGTFSQESVDSSGRNLKEIPPSEQTVLYLDIPARDGSGGGGKITLTSSRKGQVEILFDEVPREDTEEMESSDHKTKSPSNPLLRNKLVNIIRKYKSNERQHFKPMVTDRIVSIAKRFKHTEHVEGEQSIVTKISLKIRSTNEDCDPSKNESSGITSSIVGRKKTEKESDIPNVFGDTFTFNRATATLAGFEVNCVATNYISIIDRSLLLHEVTPRIPTSILGDAAARDIPDKEALKPLALNTLSIRTFDTSFFGKDLMMPSIHGDKHGKESECDDNSDDKEQSVSLSPKPDSFFDILNEGATKTVLAPQSTDDICELEPTNAMADLLANNRLNKNNEERISPIESYPTEETFDSQIPNDTVVVEDTISNGGNSDFEVIYTIRPPYKMSRSNEEDI
jgi:hypothetical protein